jgi:hypothetical protein
VCQTGAETKIVELIQRLHIAIGEKFITSTRKALVKRTFAFVTVGVNEPQIILFDQITLSAVVSVER